MPSSTITLFSVAPTARMQAWIQIRQKYTCKWHFHSSHVLMSYLRWINDCCELLDTKHAQVGDGECPTNKLLWLELTISGFCCQLSNWGTNGNQTLQFICVCVSEWVSEREREREREESIFSAKICTLPLLQLGSSVYIDQESMTHWAYNWYKSWPMTDKQWKTKIHIIIPFKLMSEWERDWELNLVDDTAKLNLLVIMDSHANAKLFH